MKVIALVQLKGGAGKSTLATTLAAQAAASASTVLIDGDAPQLSSASWASIRAENVKLRSRLSCTTADSAEALLGAVDQAEAAGAAYCFIDCAPRLERITRAALMRADLVLVPIGPSMSDVWATQDLAALLQQAEAVRPLQVRAVWNRRGPTRLFHALEESLKSVFPYPALSGLSYRVSYAEAFGLGLTVLELPGAPAAARKEAKALYSAMKRTLKDAQK